ncbi:MAG: 2OG-Fe(II) oxygenase [Bacteroidetes bacterium]|nr:2OG-Fe(II) oxygenase [Bacteroidota bacterium]
MALVGDFINLEKCPLENAGFIKTCRQTLADEGALTIPGFFHESAVASIIAEVEAEKPNAYFTSSTHNVYLTSPRDDLGPEHVFNRQITSSKGCITTDQIPPSSGLHIVYEAPEFRAFLAQIVGEAELDEYADPLSSINVHFAGDGQELGWHFDNSSFAVTLLLQAPTGGGEFQYVRDLRDADAGDLNFTGVEAVLDGRTPPSVLAADPGTLMLFRGRNSMHRVTPTLGSRTRILVVLAYNAAPGIALSEAARMTFYGRLG